MAGESPGTRKVAVVTGASRGIGRAIALELLGAGYFAALCCRSEGGARSLETELSSFAGSFTVSPFDISDEGEIRRFAGEIARRVRRVDVLVNNAGVARVGPVEETDSRQWDEIMAVNARGTFLMVKHSLALMRPGSHIVNIGSNASKTGFCGLGGLLRLEIRRLGLHQLASGRNAGQGNKGVGRFAGSDRDGHMGVAFRKMGQVENDESGSDGRGGSLGAEPALGREHRRN